MNVAAPILSDFILAGTGVWVAWLLIDPKKRSEKWADRTFERAMQSKDKAIATYIETGLRTSAFDSIPRPLTKAAIRKRGERILEKAKENRTFRAFCECPACGELDVHWLGKNTRLSVTRICKNCEYEWEQS